MPKTKDNILCSNFTSRNLTIYILDKHFYLMLIQCPTTTPTAELLTFQKTNGKIGIKDGLNHQAKNTFIDIYNSMIQKSFASDYKNMQSHKNKPSDRNCGQRVINLNIHSIHYIHSHHKGKSKNRYVGEHYQHNRYYSTN